MRSPSFADARLGRRYSGPTDPAFRRDSLKWAFPSTSASDPCLMDRLDSLFGTIRLHLLAPPDEAATRALEVLAARPPRTKELRIVGLMLGVDREAVVRGRGISLLQACEAAFPDSYKDLEAKKQEALEDGRPIFLVALGDAERLAQAQAAGVQLVELCPLRSGSARLGAAGAAAADSAGDDDSDWETASLASQQDDGSCSDGELDQASQRPGLAAAALGSAGSSASRLSLSDDSDQEGAAGLPRELRGLNPLHLAVANSDTACIQVLLKDAEERGGAEGVRALLAAPIRRPSLDGPWESAEGWTALHMAVSCADEPTVKMLLQAGASATVQTAEGESPLHVAAGVAPLDWEPWRLQVLLDLGADKLELDAVHGEHGCTVLHRLAGAGEMDLVQMLLEAGADVNCKSADSGDILVGSTGGDTPLHRAVDSGGIDVVELLLEHGADVCARNAEGMTPAELAERLGEDKIKDLLKQRQRLQRLQSHGRQGANGRSSSFRSPVPEDVPEELACAVCISRPKATILAPCGHRCLCKRCLRTIMQKDPEQRNCPVCREQIESFVLTVYE